jgi:NAD(P)H-binding
MRNLTPYPRRFQRSDRLQTDSEGRRTMRVFVAGAAGAIGTRLVPQLLDRGHQVIGTSRSPEKAERIRGLGASAVVLDVLDAEAVRKAVLVESLVLPLPSSATFLFPRILAGICSRLAGFCDLVARQGRLDSQSTCRNKACSEERFRTNSGMPPARIELARAV